MSIAIRQWQEEGRLQGLAEGMTEGMAKGKAEGMADSLIRILEARFCPLDQSVKNRIRMQSVEALETATGRALAAPTPDHVLEGFKQN